MKDKKGRSITNAFPKNLCMSGCRAAKSERGKPNKTWVDKGSEFYNRSMKSWLQNYDIEILFNTYEGKTAVGDRFIRTLKKNLEIKDFNIKKCVY